MRLKLCFLFLIMFFFTSCDRWSTFKKNIKFKTNEAVEGIDDFLEDTQEFVQDVGDAFEKFGEDGDTHVSLSSDKIVEDMVQDVLTFLGDDLDNPDPQKVKILRKLHLQLLQELASTTTE